MKSIGHFLFPGGLLFAASCVLLYGNGWGVIKPSHVDIAGLVFLAFGLFLSWRFDRSRLLYALLLLLAADVADRWFLPRGPYLSLHNVVAVLVPFNFILLGLMKEKGVRSLSSLFQHLLLPLQALLVAAWLERWDGRHLDLVLASHLPPPFEKVPDLLPALVITALAVQLFRYARYRNPVECAFVWAILGAGIAGVMTPGTGPTLFRIFAALTITTSVFEMSYALAYRDELTALPGRRALNEALRKLRGEYAIAMADIDHFKKLNDTYGHDVGDQVLKMIAARLAKCASGGQAYRYGGEEFCILFRGKNRDTAMEPLDELRRAVAAEPFIIRQALRPVSKPKKPRKRERTRKSVNVTISIGVADRSGERKSPEDVMTAADKALYRAKKAGRDRVSR